MTFSVQFSTLNTNVYRQKLQKPSPTQKTQFGATDGFIRPPKVLILDDEQPTGSLVVGTATARGLQAQHVKTIDAGIEAVEQAQAAGTPFGLYFVDTDVNAPQKRDGGVFVSWLKANVPNLEVKRDVVCSGTSLPIGFEHSDFLLCGGKPVSRISFAQILDQVYPKPA